MSVSIKMVGSVPEDIPEIDPACAEVGARFFCPDFDGGSTSYIILLHLADGEGSVVVPLDNPKTPMLWCKDPDSYVCYPATGTYDVEIIVKTKE